MTGQSTLWGDPAPPPMPGRWPPPRAGARDTDPDTSREAARSVTDLTERRAAVLATLRRLGSGTDADIAWAYPRDAPRQSPSGLRTRRSELVAAGLVRDSGLRARMESGRRAIVWEPK